MTLEQRIAAGDTEPLALKRRGRPAGSKDARPRKRRYFRVPSALCSIPHANLLTSALSWSTCRIGDEAHPQPVAHRPAIFEALSIDSAARIVPEHSLSELNGPSDVLPPPQSPTHHAWAPGDGCPLEQAAAAFDPNDACCQVDAAVLPEVEQPGGEASDREPELLGAEETTMTETDAHSSSFDDFDINWFPGADVPCDIACCCCCDAAERDGGARGAPTGASASADLLPWLPVSGGLASFSESGFAQEADADLWGHWGAADAG
jgi:hypothetical protein